MPDSRRTATPKAPTATPRSGNGVSTRPGPKAPAADPPIVSGPPITAATTGTSGFDFLGWFTVDDDGCTVQFGIEQQRYLLAATSPNYNAMFSMLLACWLDRHKVNLTYALPLIAGQTVAPDAPLRIVSLVTI